MTIIINKAARLFQHDLNGFILFVFVIMVFFLWSVVGIIVYNFTLKGVTHYIGHRKASFERVVFLLSSTALLIIRIPRFYLLYSFRSATTIDIIVKVVGGQ